MCGDLTCSVHIVNIFHCFVIIKCMYVFVFEDYMLDWHSCQIRYLLKVIAQPLESELNLEVKFQRVPYNQTFGFVTGQFVKILTSACSWKMSKKNR